MDGTSPARGRPRHAGTDQRILDAALMLLREGGPGALTVEAVGAASGVARTTIYRRYRDRRALLDAALEQLVRGALPPPDLPLEAKLRWVLDEVADLVDHGAGRGVVAAVLAGTDPELTEALRRRVRERVDALAALVAADQVDGSLSTDVDADALVGLLLGAYLGEVVRHGRARPGWGDDVLNVLVRAVGAAR